MKICLKCLLGANKIICFVSRQDVDGIDGKASLQLEVCCKGAGEEFQEMRQGLQLVFTTSSTFPVILKELIDELMRKNTTKTNFYLFAKKKMDDKKSFIGILFFSLFSPKEEKAEKLKLKKQRGGEVQEAAVKEGKRTRRPRRRNDNEKRGQEAGRALKQATLNRTNSTQLDEMRDTSSHTLDKNSSKENNCLQPSHPSQSSISDYWYLQM